VDRSVLKAAQAFSTEQGLALETRFETWLPQPDVDRPEVQRFREGKVRELHGSAQARRMRLVRDVDALITVRGKVQTAMVLDLAFTYEKPVLPLPFTGGDSGEYWQQHRAEILERLKISEPFAGELESVRVEDLSGEASRDLAARLVDALSQKIQRKCLVLMPFRPESDRFYSRWIEPLLTAQDFEPIRIDRGLETGSILEIFIERLGDSDAVLADVTGANPNVMYELGQAHARGIDPLLFYRRGTPTPDMRNELPFYLSEQKIEVCDESAEEGSASFVHRIEAYLRKLRTG
jgi:hypothetical protein